MNKIYREREDYSEGITDIYVALASKALLELVGRNEQEPFQSSEKRSEHAKRVVEYLRSADEKFRGLNEYTWLIKGFYEVAYGELIHLFMMLVVVVNDSEQAT